jgi:hypothetical protein
MAEVEFNPNLIPTGKKMKKIPELELKQKKAVTFTEEELKDLRNTFDVFDSDKDGSVICILIMPCTCTLLVYERKVLMC